MHFCNIAMCKFSCWLCSLSNVSSEPVLFLNSLSWEFETCTVKDQFGFMKMSTIGKKSKRDSRFLVTRFFLPRFYNVCSNKGSASGRIACISSMFLYLVLRIYDRYQPTFDDTYNFYADDTYEDTVVANTAFNVIAKIHIMYKLQMSLCILD